MISLQMKTITSGGKLRNFMMESNNRFLHLYENIQNEYELFAVDRDTKESVHIPMQLEIDPLIIENDIDLKDYLYDQIISLNNELTNYILQDLIHLTLEIRVRR